MNFAPILLLLCAVSASTPALAFDDKSFCDVLTKYAERERVDSGKMLDKFTRYDGMAVLCGNRTVVYYKFLTVEASALRAGWKERKQRQWNEIHCKNEVWVEAVKAGWEVATTITTVDGTQVYLAAECK